MSGDEAVFPDPLATYPYLKQRAVAEHGMVSSLDPRASAIGVEVLKRGGNAIDAAVATALAVGIVEPNMSGIGGKGGYMMMYSAEAGTVRALDFNGRAPLRATPDMFLDGEGQVRANLNTRGHLAVCTPSTVAGYAMAIESFGRLSWREVVEPSVRLAETGYQVSEVVHRHIVAHRDTLSRFPSTAQIYLKEGRPFETGGWLYPRDLARSYRVLADEGPGAFYQGEIAEAICGEMADNGGLIGREDLACYRAFLGNTASTNYRGWEIFTYGVNSGGSATIANLNLLENFDLSGIRHGSVEAIHLLAETVKLTFSDRFEYLGDPEYIRLPMRGITSKKYAAERARLVDPSRAGSFAPGDPWAYNDPDTTHVSVIDHDRNMVALTTSVGPDWGSGVVVEGTGILLNGGMNRFDPVSGRPNSVAANKRPLRNTNPILVLRDGCPYMAIGCRGGEKQISSLATVLVNHFDFGMEIQDAIDAPRIHTEGRELVLQSRVPVEVQRRLSVMGHELRLIGPYDELSPVQAVMIDPVTGLLHGGADPCAPGAAIGY